MDSNHLPLQNGRVDKRQWSLFVWRDKWLGQYVASLAEPQHRPAFRFFPLTGRHCNNDGIVKSSHVAFIGMRLKSVSISCGQMTEISRVKSYASARFTLLCRRFSPGFKQSGFFQRWQKSKVWSIKVGWFSFIGKTTQSSASFDRVSH